MGYNKLKEEEFELFGGMNQKVSKYITGNNELLYIENFNHRKIGALTGRAGCTNLVAGATITVSEFIYSAFPVWFGSTEVLAFGGYTSLYYTNHYISAAGPTRSNVLWQSGQTILKDYIAGAIIDYSYCISSNTTYFCKSGNGIFKWGNQTNGTSYGCTGPFRYGLPEPASFTTTAVSTSTFSGTIRVGLSYVDHTGYYGPMTFATAVVANTDLQVNHPTIPSGDRDYGLGQWAVYRDGITGTSLATTDMGLVRLTGIGVSTTTITFSENVIWKADDTFTGSTVKLHDKNVKFVEAFKNRIYYVTTSNELYFSEPSGEQIDRNGNAILFEQKVFTKNKAVFTTEFTTITAIKRYSDYLMIGTDRCIYRLIDNELDGGNGPELISDEYAIQSNQSCISFFNYFWFLDPSFRIVQFNGSQFDIVSEPVEDILKNINITDYPERCCKAVLDKENHEIHFFLRLNSAQFGVYPTMRLIYNYHTQAWYTSKYSFNEGFLEELPTMLDIYAAQDRKKLISGNGESFRYIYEHDDTYKTDNGVGFTGMILTRYHHNMGHSTEKMFRRLWLNTSESGGTLTCDMRLLQDYGSTYGYTLVFNIDATEIRLDFGVGAKSMAAQFYISDISSDFTIYGYTIAARYLRDV